MALETIRSDALSPLTIKKPIKAGKLARLFQQAIEAHQQQHWNEAEKRYQQVLLNDKRHVAAYINLGAVYRQNQKLEQAKTCYQQAVTYEPDRVEAWFNLGNVFFAEKNWAQAIDSFQRVIQITPQHSGAFMQLAAVARAQGDWAQVICELKQLLSFKPGTFDAQLEMGNAYRHLGQNEQALNAYQQAVKRQQNSWKAHYSLARMAEQCGNNALFEQHYPLALHYADDVSLVHLALAQTRFDNGDYAGAEQQFRLALAVNSEHFDARLGLGSVLMIQGRSEAAKTLFQQLSQTDDVWQLSQIAKVIWEHKFFAEAIAILTKIVKLRPELYDTHLNLAKAYSQVWRFSEAIMGIEKSLSIRPDCQEAQNLLADIYVRQGRCDESVAVYERRLLKEGFNQSTASSLLFTLLYSMHYDAAYKAKRHADLMALLPMPTPLPVFSNKKRADKRLKIAYISADLRDLHPVGLFLKPVFEAHDREQFSLFCYYNNRTYDKTTEQFRDSCERWTEVTGWTDERLQQQILADGIDILVDLSGQTSKNRLPVLALRAAPVQVSWLGYPHSTGLSTIDYLIADPIVCPPENDHLCTEQVYRLPEHCVFCYPVQEHYPAYQVPAEPSEVIVFGSFNNLTKVNAHTLKLWVKLLHAIPQAHLHLKTPSFTDKASIELFYADFMAQGITRERLHFTGPCGLDEMMTQYLKMDIALDPIPYNGGTTSMQALWMGVPIISLAGDNFCGRMGASIMHYAGLDDWVATSEDEYIDIAKQKAQCPTQLRALKAGLRDHLRQTPLFDNQGFTHALETAYRTIWEAHCKI